MSVHYSSVLSQLLFSKVKQEVTREARKGVPQGLISEDDLVLAAETEQLGNGEKE